MSLGLEINPTYHDPRLPPSRDMMLRTTSNPKLTHELA